MFNMIMKNDPHYYVPKSDEDITNSKNGKPLAKFAGTNAILCRKSKIEKM